MKPPTFLEVHESSGHLEKWILLAALEEVYFVFTVADVNRGVFTMYSVLLETATRMALATKREHHGGQGLIVIFWIASLKGHTVNIVYRVVPKYVQY
jgi:hypothetical protein